MEGCISTPIPNYLSTLLYCSKKPKTTQTRVTIRENSVEITLLPQINHTSMDVEKEKRGVWEGTTPDKSGKGERWM